MLSAGHFPHLLAAQAQNELRHARASAHAECRPCAHVSPPDLTITQPARYVHAHYPTLNLPLLTLTYPYPALTLP